MKVPLLFPLALLALILGHSVAAQTAPESSATLRTVSAAQVYSPTDLVALRGVVGQTIAVEGTPVLQGESKTKTVRYLNFTKNFKESIGLVLFVSKVGETIPKEKLTALVGKKIRATGKVSEYQGALQIEIEKAEQLEELP